MKLKGLNTFWINKLNIETDIKGLKKKVNL